MDSSSPSVLPRLVLIPALIAFGLASPCAKASPSPVDPVATHPAQPESEPDPNPDADSGQAYRFVPERSPSPDPEPALPRVEAPPPTATVPPAPVAPVPLAPAPRPRPLIGERPKPGAGLIASGCVLIAGAAFAGMGAIAGPGWAGVDKDTAGAVGSMSLLTGVLGAGLLAGGLKRRGRYQSWLSTNNIAKPSRQAKHRGRVRPAPPAHPIERAPLSGNGGLAVGILAVVGGGLGVATGALMPTQDDPRAEDLQAAVISVSSLAIIVGTLSTIGGGMRRAEYGKWSRHLRARAALSRGGGALVISGQF